MTLPFVVVVVVLLLLLLLLLLIIIIIIIIIRSKIQERDTSRVIFFDSVTILF